MICSNCGVQNDEGSSFCTNCGKPLTNNIGNTPSINQNSNVENKSKGKFTKMFMIRENNKNGSQSNKTKTVMKVVCTLCIVFVIVMTISIFREAKYEESLNSLRCNANNIYYTIVEYDEEGVQRYRSNVMDSTLEEEKQYASEVGTDAYLEIVEEFFESNIGGQCNNYIKN